MGIICTQLDWNRVLWSVKIGMGRRTSPCPPPPILFRRPCRVDPLLEIRWTTRLNGYLAEKTTQMMLGAGKTEWLHCTAAAAVQQWAQSFSEFESWFSRIVVFTVKFNLGILAILDNQKTVAVWDIYQWYTH